MTGPETAAPLPLPPLPPWCVCHSLSIKTSNSLREVGLPSWAASLRRAGARPGVSLLKPCHPAGSHGTCHRRQHLFCICGAPSRLTRETHLPFPLSLLDPIVRFPEAKKSHGSYRTEGRPVSGVGRAEGPSPRARAPPHQPSPRGPSTKHVALSGRSAQQVGKQTGCLGGSERNSSSMTPLRERSEGEGRGQVRQDTGWPSPAGPSPAATHPGVSQGQRPEPSAGELGPWPQVDRLLR